jgi:hypothetical protein
LGSTATIDSGTFGETRIGKGAILDNRIHVAHNVSIGAGSIITAGFNVAGSTKIGRGFICGGNTSVTGHIEICDGCPARRSFGRAKIDFQTRGLWRKPIDADARVYADESRILETTFAIETARTLETGKARKFGLKPIYFFFKPRAKDFGPKCRGKRSFNFSISRTSLRSQSQIRISSVANSPIT